MKSFIRKYISEKDEKILLELKDNLDKGFRNTKGIEMEESNLWDKCFSRSGLEYTYKVFIKCKKNRASSSKTLSVKDHRKKK